MIVLPNDKSKVRLFASDGSWIVRGGNNTTVLSAATPRMSSGGVNFFPKNNWFFKGGQMRLNYMITETSIEYYTVNNFHTGKLLL